MGIKKYFGEISVIIAALLWGCIGFFTRNLTALGFTPIQIVAVRAFFTALFMLVIILVKDPSLLKIKLKDIWMFIGTGICSYMFFNICYMNSIVENSLSVACILMYTSPIWVTVISSFLFKEALTLKKIVSLAVCLGGCVLVCMSVTLKFTKIGIVYGLLSGFGYALYSIFGKIASKKYHGFTTVFYTFIFSFAALLPFCNVGKIVSMAVTPVNISLLLGIAVVNTLLPYMFYTYGLSKIEAGKASVISIIEPVASAITGLIFFSEKIGVIGFIGMVVVFCGLYLLSSKKTNNA